MTVKKQELLEFIVYLLAVSSVLRFVVAWAQNGMSGTKMLAHYEDIMMIDLAYYVFPNWALQVQKYYMWHSMCKSQLLKMLKEYMTRVEELNNCLKMFPAGYYNGMVALQDDELLDIYEF